MPVLPPRLKPLDIELSHLPAALGGLDGYTGVRALLRLHGVPLATVDLPVSAGQVSAELLATTIEAASRRPLRLRQLAAWLSNPAVPWPPPATPADPPADFAGPWPAFSAAVCSRDRPEDVARCVAALCALDYPGDLEILVIDNAPSDERTAALVRARFPQVRYVCEDRPGLDWARSRAIVEARGEILAYTDDDVLVDRLWARAIARTFAENPGVMAVTGLVEPLELETPAQLAFEQYGGFGRGYVQRWYGINRAAGERAASEHTATGKYGTGANMAYRRAVFTRIGGFDPALDVGTITNGGGDLEMFYRVIKAGFLLVYEPQAIVRHRHRPDERSFLRQIANNGVGFYSHLERGFRTFPEERPQIVRQGIWWFWYWYIYRMLRSFVQPVNTTRWVIWAELRGGLEGLGRYSRARRTALALARPGDLPCALIAPAQTAPGLRPRAVAVRAVDLGAGLRPIIDVTAYPLTRVLVRLDGAAIGTVTLKNLYTPISAARLRETIIAQLGDRLLARLDARRLALPDTAQPDPVSLIVATDGDPGDLGACLRSLPAQGGAPIGEILVVDRGPSPTATAALLSSFAGVRHLSAPCGGLAQALSYAIAQAHGAIVVTLDARATASAGWLEQLLAPLREPGVMAVIGGLQPAELETPSQQLAARYALGGAPYAGTLDRERLAAMPGSPLAWAVGRLSNAAFRAELFGDPRVGGLDVGLPDGVAEAHLCYRLLRAGHRLAVAPEANVWLQCSHVTCDGLAMIERTAAARSALALTLALVERDPRAIRWLLLDGPRDSLIGLARRARDMLRGRANATDALVRLYGALRAPAIVLRSRAAAPPGAPAQQTRNH